MEWFVSGISTRFLIECHLFLLYWIDNFFPSKLTSSSSNLDIRRFDSRAIFLRQCRFQNVLLFPRKQTWSSRNFPSDGVPWNQLCWQTHNYLLSLWKGRRHDWIHGNHTARASRFSSTHPNSATKLRNECLGFIHVVFLSRGGGGGTSIMYAYWVCAARETPIFSSEFRWISVPEHNIFTNFPQIRSGSSPFLNLGGFCRSGEHHFKNSFRSITILHFLEEFAVPESIIFRTQSGLAAGQHGQSASARVVLAVP